MLMNLPEVKQPGSGSFWFQTSQSGSRTYVNYCAIPFHVKDKKAFHVKIYVFNRYIEICLIYMFSIYINT